jgi:hypothetical protein
MDELLQNCRLILVICCIGLGISTLEFLTQVCEFSSSGVYAWRILQLRYEGSGAQFVRWVLLPIHRAFGVGVLLVCRLCLIALLLLLPLGTMPAIMALWVLTILSLLFTMRRAIGDDGSDQMTSIVLVALAICITPWSDAMAVYVGILFIAFQACLAYSAAGVAKLISPVWRSGDAIFKVFNTCSYGNRRVADALKDMKGIRLGMCWTVMLVETLFPLCIVLPYPAVWIFLVTMGLFHVGCAVIMGLNVFQFAFIATYPAVYVIARQVSLAMYGI